MKPSFATPLIFLLALCSGGLTSCNVVGPAALIIEGPPTIDAVYTLQKERPTIIFIDDRGSRLPRRSLRLAIAQAAGGELLKEDTLLNVIEPRAALEAAAGERPGELMDLVTLARNARAEVMIYASVKSFSLTSDGQTPQPTARLSVKVVDTADNKGPVWPEGPAGHDLNFAPRVSVTALPRTTAEMMQYQEDVGREMGLALARLFHEHEARPSIRAK